MTEQAYTTDMTLRIARLERETRRLKMALAVILGAAVLATVTAATAPGGDITAERLTLTGGPGGTHAVLDSGSLAFVRTGANGETIRSEITANGFAVLIGADESTQAVLEVNTREIDLIDYRSGRRAVVTPRLIGLQTGIAGEDAPVRWVRLNENGFSIREGDGTVRWRAPE